MCTQKTRISHGMGIREILTGPEIAETRETPESREFPGNSRTVNSREGKARSHTGGREWEFPIEHPCDGLQGSWRKLGVLYRSVLCWVMAVPMHICGATLSSLSHHPFS